MANSDKCIVCSNTKLYPIYTGKMQPLGALALPVSKEEAIKARKLPLDFHSCARCGHIFNISFSYDDVPYSDDSNLMYNAGSGWNDYIDSLIERIDKQEPLKNATIIEIGCGNGIFLRKVKERFPLSKCIGFDPSIDINSIERDNSVESDIEAIKDYFTPARDLLKYQPDILICRHVIEHLDQPTEFMSEISFYCSYHNIRPLFVVEVPRMNKAIEQHRIADFIYEHVSNFTDRSFTYLMQHADFDLLDMRTAYNDEVVVAFAQASGESELKSNELKSIEQNANAYRSGIEEEIKYVMAFLETIDGKDVAFWGATGKGATFLNAFAVDAERFPLVIDSDERKCGKYVPAMGQLIQHSTILLSMPVANIVVTTSWRVGDIYSEAIARGIEFKNMYYVKDNKLVKYLPKHL